MNREQVVCADCLEHMRTMPENSVDAIVTDPPYGLSFMNREWDNFGTDTRQPGDEHYWVPDNAYGRAKVRYGWNQNKSKLRDSMEMFQLAMTPIFEEALRVAKPGAHLLCFGGTRTFHRMACAIEDAGWEIRDCIMWVYGSGFPKSMDVSKAIDKALGAERKKRGGEGEHAGNVDFGMKNRCPKCGKPYFSADPCTCPREDKQPITDAAAQWDGWGTCLKPAWEPIIVARKPLDGTVAHNVLTWGVGALNIDACRVAIEQGDDVFAKNPHTRSKGKDSGIYGKYEAAESDWSGEKGRFPANLVHDGSQMVLDLFPDTGRSSGGGMHTKGTAGNSSTNAYGSYTGGVITMSIGMGDSGSAARFFNTLRDGEESADRTYADRGGTNFAAKPGMRREPTSADRFFYCAKASKKDRNYGCERFLTWAERDQELTQLLEQASSLLVRDISESMMLNLVEQGCSTSLFGNENTVLSQEECRFITSTVIPLITASKTCSSSHHSNTSESILDAIRTSEESGISLARLADKSSQSRQDSTSGGTDTATSAASALFGVLSEIRGRARVGNFHCTVKPIALMKWLVTLVTPEGG